MKTIIIPETKIYNKNFYAKKSVRNYATRIGHSVFKKCSYIGCKTGSRLEVHHINHDIWDNRLDNLVPICSKHHTQQHGVWITGKGHSEKTKKKLSKIAKQRFRNHPERNPRWKGGISYNFKHYSKNKSEEMK
jgi:hypothetical protein